MERFVEKENDMSGTLYLCATPIGNLEDISYRVVRVLKEVDLIAAEDTRNSIKLLNHFDIHTPMTSYHDHNRFDKGYQLAEELLKGKNIALITDAGTPGISDPGEEFVRICHEKGITVTSLPGASACVTALAMSGQSTRRFAFEAFLPRDKRERERILKELQEETRTIILYEAPHHLIRTIEELKEKLGNRKMTVCREITKKHEETIETTIFDFLEYCKVKEPKGEYVVLIKGKSIEEITDQNIRKWESVDLTEHMKQYEEKGLDRKDAMKQVAKDRGISKREVYQMLLKKTIQIPT